MEFKVSVIVPAYNEKDNIPFLFKELKEKLPKEYEIILVDDGSDDGTYELAVEEAKKYEDIKILRHLKNQGKTEAIITGLKASAGEIICIYDADLQFLAEDIINLVKKIEEGYDLVCGYKIGEYEKKFVSKTYNFLARLLFKLPVRDINALKAMKKEVLLNMKLRKDWHRYIIPLAHSLGYKIGEIPVKLRKRMFGISKYSSKKRIIIGFFDLLAVAFQLTFLKKPMLYFGTIGLFSLFFGFIVGLISIILRLLGHGYRPLLYLVILLILSGILFFSLGLIGEVQASIIERLEDIEKKIK